jgi:hypothetical protein
MPKLPVQALRTGVPSGTSAPDEDDAAVELDELAALLELLAPVELDELAALDELDVLDAVDDEVAPPAPLPEVSWDTDPAQAAIPSGARRRESPSAKRETRDDDITGPLLHGDTDRQRVENCRRGYFPRFSTQVPSPSVYAIQSAPVRSRVMARSENGALLVATVQRGLCTPAASSSPSSSTVLPFGSVPSGRERSTRMGHTPCVAASAGRSIAAG